MSNTIEKSGLIEFITDLEWKNIPPRIRESIAWLCVDARACMEAGKQLHGPAIMAEFVAENFGEGRSTLLATGGRSTTAGAALANGTLMNALDLDDGHPLAKGHPGGVIIPAVLAVAEDRESEPDEFAAAITVGYEVAIRAATHQQTWLNNYHSSGSWGAIGAAAAAARLLRLDHRQVDHALGLAEFHAPLDLVMYAVADPAMAKDAMGWGAHVGVSSALLAAKGFTATGSNFAESANSATLGSEWLTDGVYVKQYPCCRWVHPALDSARGLLDELGVEKLEANDVAAIEVTTFDIATQLSSHLPNSSEGAQFNLAWPIASILATGAFDVESVTQRIHDPAITQMFSKVTSIIDRDLTAEFPSSRRSTVRITFMEGTSAKAPLMCARGDAGDTEWEEIIIRKYTQHVDPEFEDERFKQKVASDHAEEWLGTVFANMC